MAPRQHGRSRLRPCCSTVVLSGCRIEARSSSRATAGARSVLRDPVSGVPPRDEDAGRQGRAPCGARETGASSRILMFPLHERKILGTFSALLFKKLCRNNPGRAFVVQRLVRIGATRSGGHVVVRQEPSSPGLPDFVERRHVAAADLTESKRSVIIPLLCC